LDKAKQIREHMPVVCSNGDQFGTVDRVEGNSIKLTKDDYGQHHWIPMDWVKRVDAHVHIDRVSQQAMREWSSVAPQGQMVGNQGQDVTAAST
jgi:hypothetical protein